MIYVSIPSKYAKLDEKFAGYEDNNLLKFEYEKSPVHTIVYGVSVTGTIYFVKQ